MRHLVPTFLLVILACSGVVPEDGSAPTANPPPVAPVPSATSPLATPPPPSTIEPAVQTWIDLEITAAETFGEAVEIDTGERAVAIRAFLAQHPDVKRWEGPVGAILEAGNALTVELAYARHQENIKP